MQTIYTQFFVRDSNMVAWTTEPAAVFIKGGLNLDFCGPCLIKDLKVLRSPRQYEFLLFSHGDADRTGVAKPVGAGLRGLVGMRR